jgi:phosphatidylethanolamine/phosphatidyl-N-methylethanolamine N-methyltransferase
VEPSSKTAAPTGKHETWTFFRQWLRRPLSTAAVSPSSRFLARRIVAALPPGTRRVIELGAGTGTFTGAMLEHGIAPADLLAVEFNPTLHQYLRGRFPALSIIQADARALGQVQAVGEFAGRGPVQAVVSGLGLLAMPKTAQRAILQGAFALMPDDGQFIQFTYGPVAPVAADVLDDLQLDAVRRGFTLLNLPPASVYAFRRRTPGPVGRTTAGR